MEGSLFVYLFAAVTAVGLIVLGLIGMLAYRHLIRVILGLLLLESGVNLLLITIGYRPLAGAPIVQAGQAVGPMVDPLPQALVLTAIVIGVGVQALALALTIKAYQAYGTLDSRELARKVAEESGTRIIDGTPITQLPAEPAPQLEEKRA